MNDKTKSLIQLLKNISNFSEISDKHGLLNLAAKWGSPEIMTILLEKGASPLLKDQDNNTPLHYALQAKRLSWLVNTKRFEVVRQLLDAGVPYATRNEDGNTILDLVLEKLNLASEELQQKDQIKILEVGKMLIELSLLENPFLPKPSLLENSPLEKFWNDCQKIASSFSDKISAITHSLGDFIKERNLEKLAAMCRNEDIVSAVELKITDCLEQFPYYAKHLKSGLEKGLPRKLAIERCLIGIDTRKEITISKTIFENLTPYLPTKSIQAFHIAIKPSVFFQLDKKPDSSSVISEITYLPKPN